MHMSIRTSASDPPVVITVASLRARTPVCTGEGREFKVHLRLRRVGREVNLLNDDEVLAPVGRAKLERRVSRDDELVLRNEALLRVGEQAARGGADGGGGGGEDEAGVNTHRDYRLRTFPGSGDGRGE